MDWQPIIDQSIAIAAPVVGSCLLGLLGIGLGRLNAYIKAKVQGEHFRTALIQVTEAAGSAVNDLEATMRPMLSDGNLSKAEANQIKEAALNRIKTQAPKAVQTLTQAGMLELDDFLGGKIEAAVASMPQKIEVRALEIGASEKT